MGICDNKMIQSMPANNLNSNSLCLKSFEDIFVTLLGRIAKGLTSSLISRPARYNVMLQIFTNILKYCRIFLDDVLSINNPDFENYLGRMYPAELEIKYTTESNTSASFLDLLLSIQSDGQLRTSLYDKRDDFNFHITNFPFLSSNIPSSPVYGVFISQLIRYARACSSYECFILRAARLSSSKLLGQEYVMERLKSSLRKFYGRYGDLIK